MRIGLVSTQRTAVPPPRSGSVELIVGLMAEGLARRGHEVTVFGPANSSVSTRVRSVLPAGYEEDQSVWDWRSAEFFQLGLAYEHASEFDVINSHVYNYALPFTKLVRTPTVHTFHICPTPDFVRFCKMYSGGAYVLISEFQRSFFADIPVAGIIYNGIDMASFPFHPQPGGYVAYLGDFRREKGPVEAIRCARTAGIPIQLAGPPSEYFRQVIQPEVDGRTVEYIGEVGPQEKAAFLGGALALLFPSRGLEACPLVLLESMACGTPVLATGRGPIPEIVRQGVGGIHVADASEMPEKLKGIEALDRAAVRSYAAERFDISRMLDDYMRVFERLV